MRSDGKISALFVFIGRNYFVGTETCQGNTSSLVNTSIFYKAKCIRWFCHFTSTMPLCGYQVKISLQQDHLISSIKMLIFPYIIQYFILIFAKSH